MNKLLIFLCFLAHSGFCETNRIDSLKMELKNLAQIPIGYTQDTLRFNILKSLMRAYGDVSIDSSIYYNSYLIRFCKDRGLQNQMTYAQYYTGVIYEMQGKHHESIRSNYKTLKLAENQKQYVLIASILGVLAHSHASLLQYVEALALCRRGLRILHAHPGSGAYNEELALLNTEGVIFRETGKLDEALKANQGMYTLARTRPFYKWYEAHGLHAIGLVYKEQGKLTEAIKYHENALALANKIGSTFLEANIVINMADILILQKKWIKALNWSARAERMALQLNNASIIMEVQQNLYRIFKNTGKQAQALEAYEKFSSIRDSLQAEKSRQRIAAIQEQYNTEQKAHNLQQSVQLLKKENENQRLAQIRDWLIMGASGVLLVSLLLVRYNRRLREKNKELIRKNKEIKEAHFKGQAIERKRVALELHDNLSSLLSAVNMSVQSINTQHLSESEQSVYLNVKHLIQNAYAEVRNISHNILPAELEQEGLSITLTKLVERLNESLPIKFSIVILGLQERLPVEIEYNMYSIVLELLNNVIKHAQATTTSISVIRDELGINLSVTDDGIGFNPNQKKRGVGIQNVQARLESLGGDFNVLNPDERGTQIIISVPIETVGINRNVGML
ncbi:tetratricopeptide repeat-containing sensor histidine kinase [Dyadobacter arcticus]|uniref:Signal transduction histidine kinase n=1 Tax=Dyadobacter arcticus TaxID=1078754 RepID=A0ABX0UJY9_9BACT|nr:tetratricopeptide repeat-containing sensor histidine kinase [Dyadobacter arcticus]NIJ52344.1 signal transduction histidine kinase [Dyadobacter arcticus]